MKYVFDAEVWRWKARVDSWAFLSVPQDASDEIRQYIGDTPRGFGAVRVEVTIGSTTWRTSIFPGHSGGPYSLPLKKAVRRAESLDIGDSTHVRLEILDRACTTLPPSPQRHSCTMQNALPSGSASTT